MGPLLTAILGFAGQWASVFWMTLRETAPFLVFGLLLAGILHVLVSPRIILWALGQRGWRGAIRGALIGTPLPLCSCGVVPTALTLRRQGASLSATTAFTISTPETSVDALAVTAALLPSIFLAVRPLAALLLAIAVGVLVEVFSTTTREQLRLNILNLARVMDSQGQNVRLSEGQTQAAEICRVCGLMTFEQHSHKISARVGAIFSYAFGTFFRDIAAWLMLGLIVAAVIQVAVPSGGLNVGWLKTYPVLQILFATIIGIPLYSCATATTPLAAVLLTKGLNPGAVLALLLAGPATNIGNVFAFKRELGTRITVVYYIVLLVLCWGIGIGFNLLWPTIEKFPQLTQVATTPGLEWLVHGMPGWIEVGSSWLLLILTFNLWMKALIHGHQRHEDHLHHAH